MIPRYKIKLFCISVIYIRQFTYMFNYFKFIFHNYFTLQGYSESLLCLTSRQTGIVILHTSFLKILKIIPFFWLTNFIP